jgi:co-chaperonin GroES (HSP10)
LKNKKILLTENFGNLKIILYIYQKNKRSYDELYKPETAKETMSGKIVAVGDGLFTQQGVKIPMKLRVDDEVLLDGTGIQIKIDGVKYNLYRESEILMVKLSDN